MGLFTGKQKPKTTSSNDGSVPDDQANFFDEVFREELRNHGRWYFEKVINENGELFKEDLDATITQINVELKEHITTQLDAAIRQMNIELKEHVTSQLDQQLVEHEKAMKQAQDTALQSITSSAQALQEQHRQLSVDIQNNMSAQDAALKDAFQETMARVVTMKDAQGLALQSLNRSAQALQTQYQSLSKTLQENTAKQEAMLVETFKGNMALIIEHYLLTALGDQYDLKAQLPSIIEQLEASKDEIVDDMKL